MQSSRSAGSWERKSQLPGTWLQRDLGKAALEPLSVPPAVSQVEDHPGLCALHGVLHGLYGSVGVGKHQYLHRSTSSHFIGTVYPARVNLATGEKNFGIGLDRPAGTWYILFMVSNN